jgi:dynein heavy chain
MLDWLGNQVKDYLKFLPLLRVFSNPGMQERHWEEVSQFTGFQVNPEQLLLIRKLV